MANFIKVTNQAMATKLSELGFSYITKEGSDVYVYEMSDELLAMIQTLQKDDLFSARANFVIDNKLRF